MANIGRHVGFVGHVASVVGRSQCPLGAGATSVPMGTCSQWGRRHFFLPLSLIPTALSWLHDLHHIDCDPRGGIFISPIRVVLDYTEGSERVSLGFHAHFWIFISVVAVAVGNYSLVFEGNSSAMNSSAKLHLPALVAQTHLGKEGFRRSPIGLYRPLLEKFVSWVSSRRGPPKFAQDNAWQWGRQLGRLWVCSCHCQCARACVDCL